MSVSFSDNRLAVSGLFKKSCQKKINFFYHLLELKSFLIGEIVAVTMFVASRLLTSNSLFFISLQTVLNFLETLFFSSYYRGWGA